MGKEYAKTVTCWQVHRKVSVLRYILCLSVDFDFAARHLWRRAFTSPSDQTVQKCSRLFTQSMESDQRLEFPVTVGDGDWVD